MAHMMVGGGEGDVGGAAESKAHAAGEAVAEALHLAEAIERLLTRAHGLYASDYSLRLALGLARNLKDELAAVKVRSR